MIMCMVDEGKNVSVAQYRNMHSNNLLSADEIKQIQEFNGFKPFLPMMWALEEVRQHAGPLAHTPSLGSPPRRARSAPWTRAGAQHVGHFARECVRDKSLVTRHATQPPRLIFRSMWHWDLARSSFS
jgi:hypothetical protein